VQPKERHIEMQDLTPVMAMTKKQYRTPNVSVGTVKKSIAAMASRWFLRKVSHRFTGSGPLGARRIHRETLFSDRSKAFPRERGTASAVFQENVSFDHYFGTYPNAANPGGEPSFHAKPGTPAVNGLNDALLHSNPNLIQQIWVANRILSVWTALKL
jgi:hypothetical protein